MLSAAATADRAGLGAWQALSVRGAAAGLVDRAREVLRSGGHEFADGLGEASDPRMATVRAFVAARARAAALRSLAAVPREDQQPGDFELVLAEVASYDFVTQQPGLDALAALAGPENLPTLFQALPKPLRGHHTEALLRKIVELGGAEAARQLAREEDDEVATAGARALAAQPSVSNDEFVELLYHDSSSVRRAALDGLTARLDAVALGALLDNYAARPGHYYDVITALDWTLHAPEGVPRSLD